MKRHQQILVGVFVLQVILTVIVFWPRQSVASAGELVFPTLEAADIVALTITDDQGQTIELRKSGADWVLPDADDFPAQASSIEPVLEKLVGLETGRLVTRTDASHKRLQVAKDDFVRRLIFETGQGDTYVLYLGSAPQYSATHFRLEGQSETYLTDALSSWEVSATAASWVDTAYLSLTAEDVSEIVLKNANGEFTFVKDEAGAWVLADLAADEVMASSQTSSLFSRVLALNLLRPLGKTEEDYHGLASPGATVTLQTAGETITLEVGAENTGNGSYVVKASNSPFYVTVSDFNVKDLVDRVRDDFLTPPETPTPQPES
ncbi:MAG: DUF4340 domain-containing protein [Anaerolineae bacterium]|nr:DUF4340 domain-containing protein [Anaerolineae bacterium]